MDDDGPTERSAGPIEKSALDRRAAMGDMNAIAQKLFNTVKGFAEQRGITLQQSFDAILKANVARVRRKRIEAILPKPYDASKDESNLGNRQD